MALAAFALMARKRRKQTLHYIAGLGAFNIIFLAFILTLLDGEQPNRFFEIVAYLIGALVVFLQASTGLLLLLAKQMTVRFLSIHSTTSRGVLLLAGLFGILAIFGQLLSQGIAEAQVGQILAGMFFLGAALFLWFLVSPQNRLRQQSSLSKGFFHLHLLPDQITTAISHSSSILEASLVAGIPHTHVCGGNARCSTCRIAVVKGLEHCLQRNAREQALANRLHFTPEIRLACQTRVNGQVHVRRLVLDDDDIALTSQLQEGATPRAAGEELHLAILFADIRGFTSFAENLLPYDVIHALNRFYQKMGIAIQSNGGVINNYMGDGFLALFGRDGNYGAALQAVSAGLEMLDAKEALKPYFLSTYGRDISIGIGIHYGQAIVGSLGALDQERDMVIGDAVNFASRIESATKEAGAPLLISEAVYQQVKEHVQIGKKLTVPVKGKQGEHTLIEVTGLR